VTQFDPVDRLDRYKFRLSKIQVGGGRHAEKKSRYLGNGLTDRHGIWHDYTCWPSEPDLQLKFRTFKNPRWLAASILKNRKM